MNILTLKLTEQRAEELGLITCVCGCPKNNHFEHDDRLCSKCDCKSYVMTGIAGVLIREDEVDCENPRTKKLA